MSLVVAHKKRALSDGAAMRSRAQLIHCQQSRRNTTDARAKSWQQLAHAPNPHAAKASKVA
jgi:hypothetical protein